MDSHEFRRVGHELIDWIADYFDNVDQYPVLSRVQPGEIRSRLPADAPEQPEPWDAILNDFRDVILPGVTHWNHPRFFAYFPANHSAPAVLGELLSAGLGINAMLWQTCPAATELEEVVMEWLRRLVGLPVDFRGSIQDTASSATMTALLCARERTTGEAVNRGGFTAVPAGAPLRIYVSGEGHSSVEKGAKAAGFGAEHVVKVAVDGAYALEPDDLRRRIAEDRAAGRQPCAVVATVGTTGSTAVDPLPAIARICRDEDLWLHVDAALAGSAAILPEKRWLLDGAEHAHSLVFNPHKWLFTNFDCSAYFTREPALLQKTMAIDPEYLRTDRDREVTNFRDWGLPLGRRFRALKLWFVLRSFGAQGLRDKLREHLDLAQWFAGQVAADPAFELLAPVPVQTVCFRHRPEAGAAMVTSATDRAGESPPPLTGRTPEEDELDRRNKALLDRINGTGRVFLTHTRLGGRYTLRMSIGQLQTRREHVEEAWALIRAAAEPEA
ncbi:MAG: pyridoxal-dependent decarboxylase [Candidatus Krumholzibacteriia bacterium]